MAASRCSTVFHHFHHTNHKRKERNERRLLSFGSGHSQHQHSRSKENVLIYIHSTKYSELLRFLGPTFVALVPSKIFQSCPLLAVAREFSEVRRLHPAVTTDFAVPTNAAEALEDITH